MKIILFLVYLFKISFSSNLNNEKQFIPVNVFLEDRNYIDDNLFFLEKIPYNKQIKDNKLYCFLYKDLQVNENDINILLKTNEKTDLVNCKNSVLFNPILNMLHIYCKGYLFIENLKEGGNLFGLYHKIVSEKDRLKELYNHCMVKTKKF